MKKSVLFLVLLLGLLTGLTAETVSIGSGTSYGRFPLSSYYGYMRSAALYSETEIGRNGLITSLGWNVCSAATASVPVKIYLKSVADVTLTATSWVDLISDATLVYDGLSVNTPAGWKTLDINDYSYTAGNLLVLCESNYGGSGSSPYAQFYYSYASATHLSIQKDNTPPTTLLSENSNRPNIQISFLAHSPVFTATPATYDFGGRQIGTQSDIQSFTIANSGAGVINLSSLSLTGLDSSQFVLADSNSYPLALTAGASITVDVLFAPAITGLKTAAISMEADCKTNHNIALSGNAYDATITALPYTESFDGTVFPPNGWLNRQLNLTGLWTGAAAGSHPICTTHSGSGLAQFGSFLYSAGTSAALVTPQINANAANYKLTFWMYRDAAVENDSLNIYVNITDNLTDAALLGTIHRKITAFPVAPTAGWYEYSYTFAKADTVHFILFNGVSDYGNDIYLDDVTIEEVPLTVDENSLPFATVLSQNYPNPFNPVTTISFELSVTDNAELTVYNVKGELVKTLINGLQNAGKHIVDFDGAGLNSGIYFYKLETDGKSIVKPMLMLK